MSKTAHITCYEKLYDFLTDQTKVIKDFHVLDMGIGVMEYVQSEEFQEPNCKTNVIITSMCSAYACLKLWRIMNQLGSRVMYHDRLCDIQQLSRTMEASDWQILG